MARHDRPVRLIAPLLTGGLLLVLAAAAPGEDWPRFRGPNGAGVSRAADVPVAWTERDVRWKVKLPGAGHSSPVVRAGRVVVICGDDATGLRTVVCVDARDGALLWRRAFPGAKHRRHADNSPASATPAVDDRHVYVCWADPTEYVVVALDHAGNEVWRTDLGPFRAGHGHGASPIVHDGLVIVANDQDGPGELVALDRDAGTVRWRVPRKSRASYSTPCVYQPADGAAELIFANYEHGVTSVDPTTGAVNWELDVFDTRHVESTIGSPVVAGDLILAPSGWLGVRQEVVAVRPPGPGRPRPEKVYVLGRAPLSTTPLVVGDLLFLWSDLGIVTCADVRTGKVHWRERVPGSYYGSPIAVGGRVYNISREGDVVVLAAAKTYDLLAQNPLGEGSHASLAVGPGGLIARTFTHLLAVRGPAKGE